MYDVCVCLARFAVQSVSSTYTNSVFDLFSIKAVEVHFNLMQ